MRRKAGVKRDGTLTAFEFEGLGAGGAYSPNGAGLLDWLVRGLWRDPAGYNFPQSRSFVTEGVLPEMLSSGRAHWGFAFAIIAAVGVDMSKIRKRK